MEGFNNAPVVDFKGAASGAETLQQDWNEVERDSAASTNNMKTMRLHLFVYG